MTNDKPVYVELGAVIDALNAEGYTKNMRVHKKILEIPAADVRPIVYGQWIDKPTGRYGNMQSWCSACGDRSGIGGIESNRHKPWCPICGARMQDYYDYEEDNG